MNGDSETWREVYGDLQVRLTTTGRLGDKLLTNETGLLKPDERVSG